MRINLEEVLPEGREVMYKTFISRVGGALAERFPAIQGVPFPVIVLPETDEEYAAVTNTPTRKIPYAYASTSFYPYPRHVFSVRHQEDMARFKGVLDADDLGELDAVRTVVHEVVHLTQFDVSATKVSRIIRESVTELLSLVFAFQHIDYEGNQDEYLANLRGNCFYRNRVPLLANMVLGMAPDVPQVVVDYVVYLNNMPTADAARTLLYDVAGKYQVREADVRDYIEHYEYGKDLYRDTILGTLDDTFSDALPKNVADGLSYLMETTKVVKGD